MATRIAAPSIVPSIPADHPTGTRPTLPVNRPILPRCPEIDCVRHLLPPGIIAFAELHAAEIGVGADRVLITHGLVDEAIYINELARELGCTVEPFDNETREACSLSEDQMIERARTGMLPLNGVDGDELVVALQETTARTLKAVCHQQFDLAPRIRLTSCDELGRFVAQHASPTIGYKAAEKLRSERPELSAATHQGRSIATAVIVAAIAVFALVAPGNVALAIDIALGIVFLAWTALRLLSTFSHRPVMQVRHFGPDATLPVYTIIVALYREAAAVEGLIDALRRLNYPLEKIDLKLVLEPDDRTTRAALADLRLSAPVEIIIAPDSGPRTKPKALNAALPFARGKFIAVYDAEDRPEPDQLRLALETFTAVDHRLACVQARLTIDNTSDSWLTRLFTAEYAGLFDVFLPGLAAWRLPLPLGGSSNHFRGIR